MIKEWNLLRVIACLSIVLLHCTTQIGRSIGYPEITNYHFYRMLLCYATPTFIVLSEIILANRYPSKLPQNFWMKRLKFIFIPYLAFALIDAFVTFYLNPNTDLSEKIINNAVFGRYEGYFILIIFQFYILHYIVTKFKLSMVWMIPLSIYLMSFYLDMIRLNPELSAQYGMTIHIPFLAWFAYFTIAYAVGKNYKIVSEMLMKYRWMTVLLFIISLAVMYISYESGNTSVSSKRFDLLLFVIITSAMILAWGQKLPNYRIINIISNYSFGIYLIHWQVQRLVAPYIAGFFDHTSTRVLALFFVSLLISMSLIKLISLLPFGSYIIGQLKKSAPKQNSKDLTFSPPLQAMK
ncbi:acyltransferase family protein [Bacillus sp. D386]|uniref:acyltransferase family protein n=1 Tax=Bacillus sp. D386 TaxID=2587155 RepID=UPI0015D61974|nr:acyltransferase family protein [Bacillus sp. D386]